jgi:peptide/nickel transport system permease protein
MMKFLKRQPAAFVAALLLLGVIFLSLFAPLLGTLDPKGFEPANRNKRPGFERVIKEETGEQRKFTHHFGTDNLGRDIYSRALYGGRVSLALGLTVAVVSLFFGLLIGLVAGYFKRLDNIIMRIMDGLMAIPAILLAIALVSLSRSALLSVVLAIVVPEIPRVVRLVRAIVLSVREEPYVEAAVTMGTPTVKILWRHILPNCIAPLIVQGTFICAAAILTEAILSFLGIGIPVDIPTWGNIMAQGKDLFRVFPHNIFYPAIFLSLTVLSVNILGDGLRDTLDPKLAGRI